LLVIIRSCGKSGVKTTSAVYFMYALYQDLCNTGQQSHDKALLLRVAACTAHWSATGKGTSAMPNMRLKCSTKTAVPVVIPQILRDHQNPRDDAQDS